MTSKLRNYQVQVLDSLTKMEEHRQRMIADGFTTVDGETFMAPLGTITGRMSCASPKETNPPRHPNLEERPKRTPEQKAMDFAIAYGGRGGGRTMAQALSAGKLSGDELKGEFFTATKSMALFTQQLGRAIRPRAKRKQRRLIAQRKRVRPLLGVNEWTWRMRKART